MRYCHETQKPVLRQLPCFDLKVNLTIYLELSSRNKVAVGELVSVFHRAREMLLQKSKLFTVIPGTNLLHGYHG